MTKKPTVTTLQSGFNSTETLNTNFEALRDGFDNTLSLDGSTPNAMEADLDLNGNNIIGADGLLINGTDYLADVTAAKTAAQAAQAAAETAETNAETAETNAESSETAAGLSATAAATSETNAGASETAASGSATASATSATNSATSASEAAASASAASTSETNAATSETNASTSETNAATSATEAETAKTGAETARDAALAALDSFDDRYLGVKTSDPTVDNDGDALVVGAIYFNSNTELLYIYNGATWQVTASGAASGDLISTNNLSDLTSPATARTNLGLGTAATTASTDYATAAQGALADTATQPADLGTAAASDTGDFATAAQGTLADSAVQPNDSPTFAGVDVTGTITSDGLTVDTDTLHVDAANNRVGIGTSSPSSLLHVSSAASTILNVEATGVNDSRVRITAGNTSISYVEFADPDDADTGEIRYDHSDNHMGFRTNGNTERMRIDSSGNVGIGTDSPTEQLEVHSTGDTAVLVKTSGTGDADATLVLDSADSGESVLQFAHDGVNGAKIEWFTDGSPDLNLTTVGATSVIDMQPNGSRIGRFDTSGLDVNGTVTATSFEGDGSSLTGIAAGAGSVEAWVNWRQSSTVSIYSSGGVSSVTDRGTGLARINFSSTKSNVNYGFNGSANTYITSTRWDVHCIERNITDIRSTSSVGVNMGYGGYAEYDFSRATVVITQ
jgi:hypothetical protein